MLNGRTRVFAIVALGLTASLAFAASRQEERRVPQSTDRSIVVTVGCAEATYRLTTGTGDFDYQTDADLVRVFDRDGNRAEVSCETGCVGTDGLGECTLVAVAAPKTTSARALPSAGTLGQREFVPDAGLERSLSPIYIRASFVVECPGQGGSAGSTYDLSTGNAHGTCTLTYGGGGQVIGGNCNDNNGNSSYVTCGTGCTQTTGSGTCSLR